MACIMHLGTLIGQIWDRIQMHKTVKMLGLAINFEVNIKFKILTLKV